MLFRRGSSSGDLALHSRRKPSRSFAAQVLKKASVRARAASSSAEFCAGVAEDGCNGVEAKLLKPRLRVSNHQPRHCANNIVYSPYISDKAGGMGTDCGRPKAGLMRLKLRPANTAIRETQTTRNTLPSIRRGYAPHAKKILAGGNTAESSATSPYRVQYLNSACGVNFRLRRLPEPEFTPLP